MTTFATDVDADALLSDSGIVRIRSARSDDVAALRAMYERLSPDTLYLRFFTVSAALAGEDVDRLTRPADGGHHSLVAEIRGEIVGVATYERLDDPAQAEVAFLVDDAHQGRGVGMLLLEHLATVATSDGFGLTFARAIMAGWLIALLTWLLASTQESIAHLVLIWLATAPIALLSFRHSIAGSVEAFYRVASGSASLAGMGGSFVLPAVLGNAVGGVVLVALLNYGQVHHERTEAA